MNKLFTVLFLLASCAYIFAGGSQEMSENSITVATDATWPPMEYVDENREIVGFDIDLMNEVASRAGFEVTYESTAWDGIFAGLANGNYDAIISSVTITDERKKTMDFSIPYIDAGQVLIVRSETADTITSLDDMPEGSLLGAQIGTSGAFVVQAHDTLTLRSYDELGFAMEDLINERIDGIVADTPIAADFALQNPTFKGKLRIVGEVLTSELYGIVVQKGNSELLERINAALESVIADGTIESLKAKWLR